MLSFKFWATLFSFAFALVFWVTYGYGVLGISDLGGVQLRLLPYHRIVAPLPIFCSFSYHTHHLVREHPMDCFVIPISVFLFQLSVLNKMPETVIIFPSRQFHSIVSPSQAPAPRIGSRKSNQYRDLVTHIEGCKLSDCGLVILRITNGINMQRRKRLLSESDLRRVYLILMALVSRPRSALPTGASKGSAVAGLLGIACALSCMYRSIAFTYMQSCFWVSCVMRCRFWLDRRCFSRILSM
jgi:hypothetical protein